MSSARAAVERFNKVFDSQDVNAIMAAMTLDCVLEDTTTPDGVGYVGEEAVRAAWIALFAASPEGVFRTEELIEAGDRVVAQWRYDWR
jgi:ketosteroid isomerase-like protein